MTAITHNAHLVCTAHPALLVDFCGNCGARLWGEERCRECGHEREKPQRGNAGASVKELRGDEVTL